MGEKGIHLINIWSDKLNSHQTFWSTNCSYTVNVYKNVLTKQQRLSRHQGLVENIFSNYLWLTLSLAWERETIFMKDSLKDIPLESRFYLWIKAMFLDHIILKSCRITFPKVELAIIPLAVMESWLQNPVLYYWSSTTHVLKIHGKNFFQT